MADYGFEGPSNEIMGGTDIMKGEELFKTIKPNLIINELLQMPSLGQLEGVKLFNDEIQWGTEPGALKIEMSPLGSMRLVTRRLTKDLEGNDTWVCKEVYPIHDYKDQDREVKIASNLYERLTEISKQDIDSPDKEYDEIERLAQKLWYTTKKQHPSYIMFPTQLRKQDENYYKLVYEFRGQGVGAPYNGKTGRVEQFDIDLIYYPKKGMIRCFGYDIDSSSRERKFYVQPSEWDEMFSPKQDSSDIVENIVKLFLQY
jgi:hypothetical protein